MHLLVFCILLSICTWQNEVDATVVESCVYGQLRLSCPGGLIRVQEVRLGDSTCYGSNCCPRSNDCTGSPTDDHVNEVNRLCNDKTSCSVSVQSKRIGCGFLGAHAYNDYERITYDCIAVTTTTKSTTTTAKRSTSTTATTTSLTDITTTSPTTVSFLVASSTDFAHNDVIDDVTQETTTSAAEADTDSLDEDESSGHAAASAHDDVGAGGDVVNILIPVVVAVSVLVAVVVFIGCYITRRKRLEKETPAFTNPDYNVVDFRHLEHNQRQADADETAAVTTATAADGAAASPDYELESALGRLSDTPLIPPENEYSEVDEFKRRSAAGGALQSDDKKPRGGGAAAACSEYCVPTIPNSSQNVYGNIKTPAVSSTSKTDDFPAPAAHHRLVPAVKPTPIYSNVDMEMQPTTSAGVYSEPKPWNEGEYEAVGMRPRHPESEYVPVAAISNYDPVPSAVYKPTTTPNGVYFEMGGTARPSASSP